MNMSIWERLWDRSLCWVQKFILRWWSVFPPVLGLVFLLAVNLVFIIDIELTLKQNAHLQDNDETEWGFGQILAILLLFMPLRDLVEALLTRRMQKELNLGFKNAVNLKDWDTVLTYVARGADPNIDMQGKPTPIRAAYLSDRLDIVRALLDAGSDPNIEPGPRRDKRIIQRENKDCLQLLRDHDNRVIDSTSALKSMVLKGYHVGLKLLAALGSANEEDRIWRAALSFAAQTGNEAAVRFLLDAPGIDVNSPCFNREWTILLAAARGGHTAVVKLLLDVPGIDVNAPDGGGYTPLIYAAQNGHDAVVKLLLAAPGINVNAADSSGWTPLSHVAYSSLRREAREAVALLAAPGIDINARDIDGRTALTLAAAHRHREYIIELLLAKPGIEVNAPCTKGKTPLIYAVINHDEAAVRLLLAAPGIDVNATDTNGRAALTWAVFLGEEAIVKLLCGVPETIVDVSPVRRHLEPHEDWDKIKPASKDLQHECLRILVENSSFRMAAALRMALRNLEEDELERGDSENT